MSLLSRAFRLAVIFQALSLGVTAVGCVTAAPTRGSPLLQDDDKDDDDSSSSNKKKKTQAPTEDFDEFGDPFQAPPSQSGSGPASPGSPDAGTGAVTPELTSISPNTAPAGNGDIALTVRGIGFTSSSTVKVSGTNVATSFESSTSLSATIPSARRTLPGRLPITVSTGGVETTPIEFTVTAVNSPVTVRSVTPSSVIRFSAPLEVAIAGSGFTATSEVTFNGTKLTKGSSTATEIRATIPADQLEKEGSFPVVVTTDGSPVSPVNFTVQPRPRPVMTSVTPATLTQGAAATEIVVRGSNFDTATAFLAVTPAGATSANKITPTRTSTELRATLAASYFAAAGTVKIAAYTLLPDNLGWYSLETKTITVNAAPSTTAPTITTLSPSTFKASAYQQIEVTGTNFDSSCVIELDGELCTGSASCVTTAPTGSTTSLYLVYPGNLDAGNVSVRVKKGTTFSNAKLLVLTN